MGSGKFTGAVRGGKSHAWASALALLAACSLEAQDGRPAVLERLGTLADSRLRESSGVATSRTYPGIYWTHADSGDRPRIFAIRETGELLKELRVADARAVDWEDVALGPCPEPVGGGVGSCLYIGDVGDNSARRRRRSVYVVPEPNPFSSDTATAPALELRVAYPDGPDDVEAVAVFPNGDLLVVTKGRSGRVVGHRFAAAAVAAALGRSNPLLPAVSIEFPIEPARSLGRWVTGAAVSPAGDLLAIRTYTEIYLFEIIDDAIALTGQACWLGAAEPQGEAIDFMADGRMILTSESVMGLDGAVLAARCEDS